MNGRVNILIMGNIELKFNKIVVLLLRSFKVNELFLKQII